VVQGDPPWRQTEQSNQGVIDSARFATINRDAKGAGVKLTIFGIIALFITGASLGAVAHASDAKAEASYKAAVKAWRSPTKQTRRERRRVKTMMRRANAAKKKGQQDQFCKKTLKVAKLAGDCSVRTTARGRVVVFHVTGRCQEFCEVGTWLYAGRKVMRFPDRYDSRSGIEISHDLRFAFNGEDGWKNSTEFHPFLERIDLRTLKVTKLAGCTRPVISPSGKWVVCRSNTGAVMRMRVRAKKVRLYRKVKLGESIYGGAETGLGVNPVRFVGGGKIVVKTFVSDGIPVVKRLRWSER